MYMTCRPYSSDFLPDLQLCPHSCHTSPAGLPWLNHMCLWIASLPLLFHRKAFLPDACMIKFPTWFSSQFMYHLPEKSSLTTLSKTMPPVQLLCSLSCLFLHNICYLLTSYIFILPPQREWQPYRSTDFCLVGLLLYSQHLERCLVHSASRWENSLVRFKQQSSSAHNQSRTTFLWSSPSFPDLLHSPLWEFPHTISQA